MHDGVHHNVISNIYKATTNPAATAAAAANEPRLTFDAAPVKAGDVVPDGELGVLAPLGVVEFPEEG